jgi:hypothetical protein
MTTKPEPRAKPSPRLQKIKKRFIVEYPAFYLVMFDGMDGPEPSRDCPNPHRTLKGARTSISAQGKAGLYYIVRYEAERRVSR